MERLALLPRAAVRPVVALVLVVVALTWFGRSPGVTHPIDIDEPSKVELNTVARTRVLFGHQSVGANILGGISTLYDEAGVSEPPVVETRETVTSEGGFIAHAHVGVNGDPLGKLADFAKILDGPLGDEVDVAVVKFCYVDIVASTDVEAVFDAYVATISELEARHPDVRFVYTTVPLTADRGLKSRIKALLGSDDQMGPADNIARQRYNELIRERFGMSGRLFDIAAVQSTMQTAPTTRTDDGETYYVLSDDLRSDRGHLNEQGSEAAAAEFLRVIAAAAPAA